MNKAQRRAHMEPPCPACGERVVPTWKDERPRTERQPDWQVSARQCSSLSCELNDPQQW
jgi:phage terminase large subunit GpA-like protein